MKREHEPMATKPASMKPVVHQKLELDLDEGATRVHKFPKELIHRLREQESAQSSSPPSDDRTAVFRAPPELLARAMRARLAGQAGEDSTQPSQSLNELPTQPPPAGAAQDIADGVQYLTENASGIALRPSGLAGFAEVPATRTTLEEAEAMPVASSAQTDDGWSFPEPSSQGSAGLGLPSFATPLEPLEESPPVSLVENDPVTEALLNTDVDALLAPPIPSPRALGYTAPAAALADVSAPPTSIASVPAPPRKSRKRALLIALVVLVAVAACVRLALALS
jgi:hypothetical protein